MNNPQFRSRPVIIDPYDRIVQQAYNRLPQDKQKNIDVIKLEPSCPGDKKAWVSNEDLLKGSKGKERIIHLCLNKIKDEFKKIYKSPFSMMNSEQHHKMEDLIVTYLKDVILPHEEEHIKQEIKGEGDFGVGAEPKAERVEDWKKLEQMGITRKKVSCVLEKYFSLTSSICH